MCNNIEIELAEELCEPIQVTLATSVSSSLAVSVSDFTSLITEEELQIAISTHNTSTSAHQDIRDAKIDKPLTATSGNVAIFNGERNVIDSGIPSRRVTVLDLSGIIPQKHMPAIYVPNVDNIHFHLLQVRTNEYNESELIIGEPEIIEKGF